MAPEVAGALPDTAGEVLAVTRDGRAAAYVVATRTHVCVVEAGALTLERAWHLVDTGSWDDESRELTVTWVDKAPPARWRLEDPGTFPQVLRERTQASVVLADEVDLGGRRRARVVVRKDLATGALLLQSLYRAGVDPDDLELAAAVDDVARRMGEQVGLGS